MTINRTRFTPAAAAMVFAVAAMPTLDFEIDPFVFGGFADLTLGGFTVVRNDDSFFLDDNVGPVRVLVEGGPWDFANAVTVPVGPPGPSVPEPLTALLLGAGLSALGASRPRRR